MDKDPDEFEEDPDHQKKVARKLARALREGSFLVTERNLSQMEEEWTGTPRLSHLGINKFLVAITLSTSVSEKSEQVRAITCIAIELDAVDIIGREANCENNWLKTLKKRAPEPDEEIVISIVRKLRDSYTNRTLGFAFHFLRRMLQPLKNSDVADVTGW